MDLRRAFGLAGAASGRLGEAAPRPDTPSRYRPAEARQNEAWAPNIAWDEHAPNEADDFAGPPANIRRSLTLVPDEARSFFDLVGHQYLPGPAMRDFGREYRAIR